jgi:hypothetical protein
MIFGDLEKERLRRLMFEGEKRCGYEIWDLLTWVIYAFPATSTRIVPDQGFRLIGVLAVATAIPTLGRSGRGPICSKTSIWHHLSTLATKTHE